MTVIEQLQDRLTALGLTAVEAQLEAWAAQIADAVAEASDADPTAISPGSWSAALEILRLQWQTSRNRAASNS